MKRHKAFRTLSRDHHHGLVLAQLIKSGSPNYKDLPKTTVDKKNYTLKFFEENLIPHFKKEEEVLFPLSEVKGADIKKIVSELTEQHREVYKLIELLKQSAEPENELNELGKLLELHIRKEERILFQELQMILSEDELLKLENDLDEPSTNCKI